ncbi:MULTISPECIES: NnrU family protein [Rhodanobacter]|uniref:NnrU family protein n=1 Tax=Rhodanobacter TaxID=75309 RepID=UPI0003FD112C|nr:MULTISPECIES: NnrU family protein [Rhodanobacter]TAN18950.1 MAG: NnrU family protein [Rhodanobacter sp.]UJJ55530.1 NnrU family protein [Rhodanobacter thiooxydans]
MAMLVLGLLIFLGVHSLRIFADGWRSRQLARLGEIRWKGLYSLVSLVGFVLICWGFVLARQQPVLLYVPPPWLRHLNALFTLVAFVLVVAAYVPRNHLKASFGHPMLLGVKTWAFGHLLAAGMLHDVVLFGAFLLWSIVLFVASRRRDRREGTVYPSGTMPGTTLTVVVGVVTWALFAFWLHALLIGVKPMV